MKKKLGIITIGQSPRVDVVPEIVMRISADLEILERGALDNFSPGEIAKLAPDPGMFQLVTRLRDGSEVTVGKEKIMQNLRDAIVDLNQCSVNLIVLLCNGEFEKFESDCLIIQPQNVVNNFIRGILDYSRHLGIIVPIEAQAEWASTSFSGIVSKTTVAVASPYSRSDTFTAATKHLNDAGCDLAILYCMGFTKQFGVKVHNQCRMPVLVSSSLVASAINEILM